MQEAERAFAAQQMITNGTIKDRAMSMTGASAGVMKYMASLNITSVSEMTFAQRVRASTIALKEQALAWLATPMGMATVAITGISLLITGISKFNQKIQESRQEMIQLGQQAADTNKQLYDLISQYSKLGKDGQIDLSDQETAKGIQEQIVELVGDQAKNIDLVNGKYDEEIEKLQQIKALGVGDSYNDISRAAKSAEANLRDGYTDKGFDGSAAHTIMGGSYQTKSESEAIKKVMTENGFEDFISEIQGVYKFKADTTSPEKMVESYYKAVELASVIARDYGEDIENSEGALYDFYNNLNKFIDNNKEDVEAYSAAIKNLHTMDANADLAEYLKTNDINSQDAFNSYIEGIKNSTEYSDAYKQVLIDVANDAFPQFSNAAKDAGENANKMTVSLETFNKEMDKIQEGYDAVQSAIDEYNEKGYLSVDATQKLLELDDELLATMVDENGQVDLNTLAFEDLARAKLENLKASATEALTGWISKLEEEGTTADELAAKYIKVATAKDLANGEVSTGYTDRDGNWVDITNTPEYKAYLAKQKAINDAIAGIGKGGLGKDSGKSKKDINKEHLKKLREYAEKVSDIQEELAEKEKDFAENMDEAWKEERLARFKDDLEKRTDIINRYKKDIEIDDFGLDFIGEDDFLNKSDTLTRKLSNLTEYGKAMREEFDRLVNTMPQTAEEAQEIANRMEELGSEMRSNVSNIRKTSIELQNLSIDMASVLIDEHFGRLQNEIDSVDRRIKILRSDYKDDYKNSMDILNMELLLPVASDYDKQRREKQRSDQALIDVTQETQDQINDIITKSLEMQFEENAKAREKERQKLIEDMEKARKDAEKKLAEAHQDYLDFLSDNKLATSKGVQEITNMFADAKLKLPDVDISTIDDAVVKIKEKLKDVFDGEYGDSTGTSLSDSPAANNKTGNTQGGKNCVNYARARVQEITGKNTNGVVLTSESRAQTFGYNLKGRVALNKGVVTDEFKNALRPGSVISQYTTYSPHPNGGYYGHVIVVEGYDSKTNTLTYSDSNTGTKARTINLDAYVEELAKKGHYMTGVVPPSAYAVGTPSGNAQAKHLGIAGENYKPEILIDKATGERTYIDSPTVIDTSKTDVVGEKQTARLPKFATGTPMSNEQYKAWIKEACDAFGIPYNIALSLIDQESGNGTARDTWKYNSAGAYGLTQITSSAMGDLTDGTKVANKYKDLLEANGIDLSKARGAGEAYARDNIWTGLATLAAIKERYFNGSSSSRGTDTDWSKSLGWYYAGGGWNGKDGKWYSDQVLNRANTSAFMNAITSSLGVEGSVDATDGIDVNIEITYDPNENYMDKILNATTKEEVIQANQSRNMKIREEGLYAKTYSDDEIFKLWKNGGLADALNEERTSKFLEDIDSFYSAAVSDIGRVVMDYRDDILAIENNDDLDDFEKSQAMYDVLYKRGQGVAAVGNKTYEYINSMFEAWIKGVEEGTEKWSPEVFNAYTDTLADLKDYIFEQEDTAVKYKQAGAEDRWGISDNWIADRNFYKDWALFDDTEVDAWERVVKWLHEDYPDDINKIKEAEKSLFEARKNEFNKATSFGNTYLESQKTLLQSHFNVTNSIAEARHEINKELATSKTMYEYIDEETRQLLFNQEDYNKLTKELSKIQSKALKLQEQYKADLDNSTAETIEGITANYERQYETLMKSYEIAKADLEIAKKKQKLNNVLNERNVRMFINGSWQWVANTEDVANAKSELADAEYERQVAKSGLAQKEAIDDFTKQQESLDLVVKNFEGGVISLGDAVNAACTAIGYIPEAMMDMLENAGVDTKAYSSGSGSRSYNGVWYYSNHDYMKDILDASSEDEVIAINKIRTAKVFGDNLVGYEISDEDAIKEWKKAKGLASGTSYTTGGLTKMGEDGFEAYINSTGRLIPISLPAIGKIPSGGIVFNTEQMKNLRTLWDMSNFNLSGNMNHIGNSQPQTIDQSQDNRIIINGMTVDSGSADGQALISALRRYVGNH